MNKEDIKKEILEKIREYHNLNSDQEFIPGKTRIGYGGRIYDEKELIAATENILDFWLTLGKAGKEFEKRFSEFNNVKHTILTNSGSSANLLAVCSLTSKKLENNLKPDDEVITPALTFPTTVSPIIQNNLTPSFVDVEVDTYNADIREVEKSISKKTKAIILPHTLGNPNNMDFYKEVCEDNNLFLIEDSCDALGSKFKGKNVGTFGDIGTFSFYPAHHITMGEGGALITNNIELKRIICSFRDWGRDCWCETGISNSCGKRFSQKFDNLPYGYDHKYVYSHIGYNLKPTDIQAAIGIEQLKKYSYFAEKRKENFDMLLKSLSRFKDIFIFPKQIKESSPSWFAFPLTIRQESKIDRNKLTTFLEENLIETRLIFAGNITKQPAYRNIKLKMNGELKNTDYIMNNSFFIGVYPGIDNKRNKYIIEKFEEFINKEG